MHLLECLGDGTYRLKKNLYGDRIPPYAILSHTWGEDEIEVSYKNFEDGTGESKRGYSKIRFCGERAQRDGLKYFWIDTCCIDKGNSTELQEAINSMFQWYAKSTKCYALLSDVSVSSADEDGLRRAWKPIFQKSRWFSRGWTLQELIAPKIVQFFSAEGQLLGDRISLEGTIHDITGVSIHALRGRPMHEFSPEERMKWALSRTRTREEDAAYSLLGIFDIDMYLSYGEGKTRAMTRLRRKIDKSLKDRDPDSTSNPPNFGSRSTTGKTYGEDTTTNGSGTSE